MTAFTEIAIILAVTFGISIIMRILKQPLIIGYIFSGIIAGPYVLNVIHSQEIMELLSKIGITALLFIVGLGLSPKVLKETGLAAGATGFGQIFFTTLITYFSATALGFNSLESFYIALSFGFSSTIIILKLLSDKGDTHKLYGRVAVGFLLVEDLVATIALVIISGISNIGNGSIIDIISKLGVLLGTGFVLLIILFLFSTHVLSRLNNFVSKSQEFLFIFSLAWGLTIAMIYQKLGLSIEIGALVAGVTLSMTPYSYEISARLKPLRDFFILMFFILLGSHMAFGNINQLLLPALILSTIILFGKPLAIFVIMNLLGFTRKNAFLSGLVAAQISEFSLILVTLGNSIGHVSNQALSLVTLVGIFTISGSTYLVMFNEAIFKKLNKLVSFFELRKFSKEVKHKEKGIKGIIFGYDRAGPEYGKLFKEQKIKFMVVDFNPEIISKVEKEGIICEYGDVSDVEFLEEFPVESLQISISTIPDFETNALLTTLLRKRNKDMVIVTHAQNKKEAVKLYSLGASNVVLSDYIGARHTGAVITKLGLDDSSYNRYKEKHIKELI